MVTKQLLFESSHLLFSAEAYQFFGNWTLGTSQRGHGITRCNHKATQDSGGLGHLICRSKQLPERMAAQRVIKFAPGKPVAQGPVFDGAHIAVMVDFFRETARLPAPHAGGKNGNVVDAAPANRNVASDFLETLAPKKLARAGHVFGAHVAIIVGFAGLSR